MFIPPSCFLACWSCPEEWNVKRRRILQTLTWAPDVGHNSLAKSMDPLIQPYSNFSNYSSANSSLESQYVVLQFWTCFFINSRNSTFPTLLNKNLIFTCKLHVKYVLNTECTIAGAMVPCGFWICIGLTAVIIIFSNFGIFTNILNLLILPKSLKGSSVRRLMMLLAIFDLLASVCAIPTALLMIFILGKVHLTFISTYLSHHVYYYAG